jgi:hypothetical protein
MRRRVGLTISSAPRSTPHKTLLHHRSRIPPLLPGSSSSSSGSSTKRASGLSSSINATSCTAVPEPAPDAPAAGADTVTTLGTMLRNSLKPTWVAADQYSILRATEKATCARHTRLSTSKGPLLTLAMTSAVSRNPLQRGTPLRARKSSIRRVPML